MIVLWVLKPFSNFTKCHQWTHWYTQKCFIDNIKCSCIVFFFLRIFFFFFSFPICTKSHNNWYWVLVRVYPLILCMWDLWKELLSKRHLEFAVWIAKWTISCTAAVYIAITLLVYHTFPKDPFILICYWSISHHCNFIDQLWFSLLVEGQFGLRAVCTR